MATSLYCLLAATVLILITPLHAASALPSIVTYSNAFYSSAGGSQFFIKGVVYDYPTESGSAIDPLANPAQCAIDAPLIRALGANAIRVVYVDPTQSHAQCMQTFNDNSIYVMVDLTPTNTTSSTVYKWDVSTFDSSSAIIDSFAQYSNVLGFAISGIVDRYGDYTEHPAFPLDAKAAVTQLKAYIQQRQYRDIPLGYMSVLLSQHYVENWMICGGNASESADFIGIADYTWCGTSTFTQSGYSPLVSAFSNFDVPVFFAEEGCDSSPPRTFSDQAAVFGSAMSGIWSGTFIYSWANPNGSAYNLVSVTSATASPSLLVDYTNLRNQWTTLSPSGTNSQSRTVLPSLSCPTTNSAWTINPAASLPLLVGLNSAPATTSGSQTTTGSSGTQVSSTATGSPNSAPSTNSSGSSSGHSLSGGAIAGIVIGALFAILAVIAILFFLRRSKRRKTLLPVSTNQTHEKPEMYAGPVNSRIAGAVRPKSELHNTALAGRPSNIKQTEKIPSPPTAAQASGTDSYKQTANTAGYELDGKTSANAPWSGYLDGRQPPELHSSQIYEMGPLAAAYGGQSQAQTRTVAGDGARPAEHPYTSNAGPGSTAFAPAVGPEPFPLDESELAEEADIAVQELGLISVRKRALISQAQAAGQDPAMVAGRKGEEFRDILQRETRIRARLDEIQRQLNQSR